MFGKISWCAALAVISVFISSCGSAGMNTASVSTGPATVTVSEKDNNTSIELNKGDILAVELAGNPTTGFQWQQVGSDTAILHEQGEPEFKPDSSNTGSPGRVDLRFEAVGSGQMQLQLAYQRSFEPQTPASQTFTINVTVK